ncbi:MAG TPA: response regulator [Myxococcales bacterium]|nr:response regulator [Myxococcales bacterium]
MNLRTHLLLLLFSVTIGGATLTFANDRWHASLERRHQAMGSESLFLEKLRNISSSFGRFLVTYDLVFFSGITYLGEDALLQLDDLNRALDELPPSQGTSEVISKIEQSLGGISESLLDVAKGTSNRPASAQAEKTLLGMVNALNTLIARVEVKSSIDRKELDDQLRMHDVVWAASLLTYAGLLFLLVIWSSRRLAGPVDAIAKLAEYKIGAAIPMLEKTAGPTEFERIAKSIHRLIVSLEETVEERTAALAGQVSEHKKTQDSLELSHAELETSVEELRKAQRALVQKERLTALGEMVSGISHDFNNVLVPIISYSSILLEEPDIDSAEREELLTVVKTAAEDAAGIIKRLREFNRTTESPNISETVNIDEVVEDAVAMSEPRWKVHDDLSHAPIEVSCEATSLGKISGSTAELRQAVINLIFNAVDASPEGGEIRISTRSEGDFVVVEVADTGTGMSKETLDACRKPFFSTKEERGTGLGLAMVSNTAISHSGRLDIDSVAGRGTSVRMLLPRILSKTSEAEPDESNDSLDTGLQILIVDDDELVVNAHAAVLRHLGFVPQLSCLPLEALEQLRVKSFDIVITDLRMPGISGLEFARQAKQNCPGARVFLLTAFEGGLPEASDLSCIDEILLKPISMARLKKAISRVSSQHLH